MKMAGPSTRWRTDGHMIRNHLIGIVERGGMGRCPCIGTSGWHIKDPDSLFHLQCLQTRPAMNIFSFFLETSGLSDKTTNENTQGPSFKMKKNSETYYLHNRPHDKCFHVNKDG